MSDQFFAMVISAACGMVGGVIIGANAVRNSVEENLPVAVQELRDEGVIRAGVYPSDMRDCVYIVDYETYQRIAKERSP